MARKAKHSEEDINIATEDDLAVIEQVDASSTKNITKKKPKRNTSGWEWFKLDNAANIYPATMTRDWNAVYRVSVVLTDEINPDALQQAAEDLQPRFPTFYVQVRKGFFWYYLEPTDCVRVEKETRYPCRPFPVGVGNKPLFRIIYYKNRISFEAFHSVTDGTGAMQYLWCLISRYLMLCGVELGEVPGVLDYRDDPNDAELEDSFHRYYKPVKTVNRIDSRAWTYKGPRSLDNDFYRVIKGSFSVEALKKLTKAKGVSITQYLTALVILSFAQTRRTPSKRPIRVCVPINLRKFFPSTTLRNFSLFANVGLPCSKETDIDEILAAIVPQLKENFETGRLQETFSMNVKPEKNLMLRITPLYFKEIVLGVIGRKLGDTRVTTGFSNIGSIDVPAGLKPYVKELFAVMGPSYINGTNVSSSSIGDRMTVVFASFFTSTEVQSYFFHHLKKNGIDVEVESNV